MVLNNSGVRAGRRLPLLADADRPDVRHGALEERKRHTGVALYEVAQSPEQLNMCLSCCLSAPTATTDCLYAEQESLNNETQSVF